MHQSKSMKSRNVAQSLVAEKNYTSEHLRKRFRSTQRNGALMLTENSANNTNLDVDNTASNNFTTCLPVYPLFQVDDPFPRVCSNSHPCRPPTSVLFPRLVYELLMQ